MILQHGKGKQAKPVLTIEIRTLNRKVNSCAFYSHFSIE
jgi:hypothetical protein